MQFAVVQQLPEPVAVVDLIKAFETLPELTSIDAHSMARDSFGVIVDSLAEGSAHTIRRMLAMRGVKTQVVPMKDIPGLPPAKRLRRLDVETDALVLYDPLGRPVQVAWERVRLLAAGMVKVTEYSHRQVRRSVPNTSFQHSKYRTPATSLYQTADYNRQESIAERLMVEIQLDVPPWRYLAKGHEFQYDTLGDELSSDDGQNFLHLVSLLVLHAPHAYFNRGIHHLPHDPKEFFLYPTRHAFEEEIRWLLWRHLGTSRLEP